MSCRTARGALPGNHLFGASANTNTNTGDPDDEFGQDVDVDVVRYGDEIADDGTVGGWLIAWILAILTVKTLRRLTCIVGMFAVVYFGRDIFFS